MGGIARWAPVGVGGGVGSCEGGVQVVAAGAGGATCALAKQMHGACIAALWSRFVLLTHLLSNKRGGCKQ